MGDTMRELVEALLEVVDGGRRGALATVIRTSGSAPQIPGARLLLRPDGRTTGTVGGGALEAEVLEALRACIADGRPHTLERDLGADLGMACGGSMTLFVEPVEGSPRLVLFGAGHVARPTAALARTVGFEVTVVDDRPELNTADRFPGCARRLEDPGEAAEALALTDRDWILVLTRDHETDEAAVEAALARPHRYLGLIGSRRKVYRVLQRIAARAGGVPDLSRLHAPVGLDLGAVTPGEIAVSIAAELVALRHGRPASHLTAVDDDGLRRVLSGALAAEDAARLPPREAG